MKTRKQFSGLIAMAIIAILALSMTGCKPEDVCNCPNGTEHLFGQSCCDGTDCKCGVYYGTLPNGVKIYKGDASITDAQMAIDVQNVIAGYNKGLSTAWSGAIKKIIMILNAVYTWDGNILGIKYNSDVDTCNILLDMANKGTLPKTN